MRWLCCVTREFSSEEHLLPLMVVVGGGRWGGERDQARRVYFEETFMGSAKLSSYCLEAGA